MPTLPWTSEDQALFLLSRFPDWEVAVATKRRGKKNPDKAAFINETLELWDKHWPLYWMNLPEEQLTSKRTGRVSTRDEYSRRRVSQWFDNHAATLAKVQNVVPALKGEAIITKATSKSRLQYVFYEMFKDDPDRKLKDHWEKAKADEAARVGPKQFKAGPFFSKWTSAQWKTATTNDAELRKLVEKQRDADYESSLKPPALQYVDAQQITPEESKRRDHAFQRQARIDCIPEYVSKAQSELRESTDWLAWIIVAGPQPKDGGKIAVIHSSIGETLSGKLSFEQSNPEAVTNAINAFQLFATQCFDPKECRRVSLSDIELAKEPSTETAGDLTASSTTTTVADQATSITPQDVTVESSANIAAPNDTSNAATNSTGTSDTSSPVTPAQSDDPPSEIASATPSPANDIVDIPKLNPISVTTASNTASAIAPPAATPPYLLMDSPSSTIIIVVRSFGDAASELNTVLQELDINIPSRANDWVRGAAELFLLAFGDHGKEIVRLWLKMEATNRFAIGNASEHKISKNGLSQLEDWNAARRPVLAIPKTAIPLDGFCEAFCTWWTKLQPEARGNKEGGALFFPRVENLEAWHWGRLWKAGKDGIVLGLIAMAWISILESREGGDIELGPAEAQTLSRADQAIEEIVYVLTSMNAYCSADNAGGRVAALGIAGELGAGRAKRVTTNDAVATTTATAQKRKKSGAVEKPAKKRKTS